MRRLAAANQAKFEFDWHQSEATLYIFVFHGGSDRQLLHVPALILVGQIAHIELGRQLTRDQIELPAREILKVLIRSLVQ